MYQGRKDQNHARLIGVFHSLLNNNSETGDEERDPNRMREEEQDCGQRRSYRANEITSRSPVDVLPTTEDCSEHPKVPSNPPVRRVPSMTVLRQDDRMGTLDSTAGDTQVVTQSTIAESTLSGERPCQGEQEEISSDEVDEDQLEGCSQETRDTIESWTA
ncbi:hypothetical protein GSI_01896 [Ganoderma sinense ZZ0214-1]|uniref:Uncharacterized protein n=1 Tax=Ganoderma sinense ZZ0214-1 TaxID=1077348 RepID=A0A2G8SR57_9APHY|nr:hypothetical protein GSI_01896 [Ganoderma sinense ZZ0214-1]